MQKERAEPVSSILGRRIRFLQRRFDRETIYPQPPDRDPTDQIRAYPFSRALLHKSPYLSSYSTRGPQPFKNNYRLGMFYSLKPLIFPNFEPAVQSVVFAS